jgi:16S rRNA U1498 N3-methylase RsmE
VTVGQPLRVFVPPSAFADGRLHLTAPDAARLVDRGARVGAEIVVLDGSGWAWTVTLERCESGLCAGTAAGRKLATERRTKVTLYQGLLHPSDFRRLLIAATRAGVVSFVPVIADGSPIAALGRMTADDDMEVWADVVRDAAEAGTRGLRPSVCAPVLFDHAFDDVARGGGALVLGRTGLSIHAALADRPFSVGLFSPPQPGFSPAELSRALARGAHVVTVAPRVSDPVRAVSTALAEVYDALD